MMRRNVDTTLTARLCQLACMLFILIMVLGVLAQDIMRNADTADAAAGGDKPARLVVVP